MSDDGVAKWLTERERAAWNAVVYRGDFVCRSAMGNDEDEFTDVLVDALAAIAGVREAIARQPRGRGEG